MEAWGDCDAALYGDSRGWCGAADLPAPPRLLPIFRRRCVACERRGAAGILVAPNPTAYTALAGGRSIGRADACFRKNLAAPTVLPVLEVWPTLPACPPPAAVIAGTVTRPAAAATLHHLAAALRAHAAAAPGTPAAIPALLRAINPAVMRIAVALLEITDSGGGGAIVPTSAAPLSAPFAAGAAPWMAAAPMAALCPLRAFDELGGDSSGSDDDSEGDDDGGGGDDAALPRAATPPDAVAGTWRHTACLHATITVPAPALATALADHAPLTLRLVCGVILPAALIAEKGAGATELRAAAAAGNCIWLAQTVELPPL